MVRPIPTSAVCRAHAQCLQLNVSQEEDLGSIVALELRDRNIKEISGLEQCTSLRTLDLSFNGIKLLQG